MPLVSRRPNPIAGPVDFKLHHYRSLGALAIQSLHDIYSISGMTLNRIGTLLALLAVICVLTVFFVHAIQGPYSVVHGPVTALLSARAAVGLRMAIMHAASSAPQIRLASLASLSFMAVPIAWIEPASSHASPVLTLRC
jgi:hypothetical protein